MKAIVLCVCSVFFLSVVVAVDIPSILNSIEYQLGFPSIELDSYDKLSSKTIATLKKISKKDPFFTYDVTSIQKYERQIFSYGGSVKSPLKYSLRIRRDLFTNSTPQMNFKIKGVNVNTFVPPTLGPLVDPNAVKMKFEMDVHCNTTRISHTTTITSNLLENYLTTNVTMNVWEMQQWLTDIVDMLQISKDSVWIPKKTYDWEMTMDLTIQGTKIGSTLSKFFPNLESFFEDANDGAGDWSYRVKSKRFKPSFIDFCNQIYQDGLDTGMFGPTSDQCEVTSTYPHMTKPKINIL